MTSFARKIAGLIDAQGKVKSDKVDTFDSAEVSTIVSENVSGSMIYYDTLDSLPTTGLNEGNKALVRIDSSLGRFYISNGIGWYNADATLNTSSPTWTTEPNASYEIADSVTPLTITALSSDVDSGTVLINQSFASDSAQYIATISNDSSVWTFTGKTKSQIADAVDAGNLTDSDGDFIYTFKWSDGFNFISKAVTISYNPAAGGVPAEGSFYGNRGIYFSGTNSAYYADIDYWDMVTASDGTKFGDLNIGYRYYAGGAASNNDRAVYMGGSGDATSYGDTYAGYGTNKISYITCSTPANASSFGLLSTRPRINYQAVEGDGTYAVSAGGGKLDASNQASTDKSVNSMEYVTIDTTGNSSAMGGLTAAREMQSALSNGTTMVVGGGMFTQHSSAGSPMYVTYNIMDYFVVANFGSASDFGDLLNHTTQLAGAGTGAGDRGLFMGGLTFTPYSGNSYPSSTYSDVIQYITVSSPGNAQDFGDLRGGFAGSQASGDAYTHGCCNATQAQYVGGYSYRTGSGASLSEIQTVTMDTMGNATKHGDLTYARYGGGATSGGSA